jgi:hypothetical protein
MPAATDFHVNGPTKIYWDIRGTAVPSNQLGFTDNDDLIRITVREHIRTFSRNDTGDMIAEAVRNGTTATIDFTMVSWNQTELEKLIKIVRSGGASATSGIANEGLFSGVGLAIVNGSSKGTIALRIQPTNSGETVYTFKNLMLVTGPEYIDFGNTLKRIAFSFTSVVPVNEPAETTFATTSTSS